MIGKELRLLNLGLLMLTNTKHPCSESSYTYQYHHIPSFCSKSHYSLRFSQEPTYEKAAGEVNIHREWSSCYLIYSEKVCNWYDVMYVKNLRSVETLYLLYVTTNCRYVKVYIVLSTRQYFVVYLLLYLQYI